MAIARWYELIAKSSYRPIGRQCRVAPPIRLIGHEHEATLDESEGFVVPPSLMREHTGVMQRTRMTGAVSSTRRYNSWASSNCSPFCRRIASDIASSSVNSRAGDSDVP